MRPTMETPYGDIRRPGVRVDNPLVAIALTAGLITLVVILYRAGVWGPVNVNGRQSQGGAVLGSFANVEAVLAAADKALQSQDMPRADAILARGIEQFPAEQELRVRRAETLMAQKNAAQAYEEFVAALAIGPRTHELEFSAGTMANMAGLTARAAEHYSAAHASQPRNATYALYLAQVQRKLNDMPAAKANLIIAGKLNPDDATAWGVLADISLQENNLEMTLQHIAKARAIDPSSREWRLIEARALKRKGDPERAIMVLQGIDEPERHDPLIVRLLAECFAMLERPADAGEAFAEASDAHPEDAELAYETATWFARAEQNDKALHYAKRAISLGHQQAVKLVERLGR